MATARAGEAFTPAEITAVPRRGMMQPTDEYTWLFRTEYASVVRTVYFIGHDRARAEEIAQEAFLQLLLHWRKVSNYERPDAWIRRVAIRMAVRETKRERARRSLEDQAVDRSVAPDRDLELLEAVRRLSPMRRAVVVLFYYEDRPMAEIGHILGISESNGFVHLHRARKELAALLNEEVDDDRP
jgi:RNA polymerase sigma-70 factor, ECF subfamily